MAATRYERETGKEAIKTSDIGCYALGANPPLSMDDTAVCMGGSFGMADPEMRLAVGYVMNHMGNNLRGDPRQVALLDAVYACL